MARTWTRLALEAEQTLKQSRPPLQLIVPNPPEFTLHGRRWRVLEQSSERQESRDAGSVLETLHLELHPLAKVTSMPETGG